MNYNFIEKLIGEINSLRKQLLPFNNKSYINSLRAKEVGDLEKQMRSLWEFYYEESITRGVLKNNKIKKELTSSSKYQCLVSEENKEFQEFKEDVEESLA